MSESFSFHSALNVLRGQTGLWSRMCWVSGQLCAFHMQCIAFVGAELLFPVLVSFSPLGHFLLIATSRVFCTW